MSEWVGVTPRAWQVEALPKALASQRGVIRAATGSGKSICQAEVIAQTIDSLSDDERIVVSVPTQELVRQLAATIKRRCGHVVGTYYQHAKELDKPVIVTCHASMAAADPVLHCPECDGDADGARELDGDDRSTARAIMVAWGMDDEQPTICLHLDTHQRVQELVPVGLAGERLRVALWMADECHKTECAQVIQWHKWTQPARQVGFTATPWRADEKQRLSLWDEVLYDYGPMDAIRDGVILAPTIIGWEGKGTRDEASLELITDHLHHHRGPGVVSASSVEDAMGFAQLLGEVGVRASVISYHDKGDARDALLGRLKDGELDCLVYCSLLAEGVDLPWLQWLCLRRGAGSRVRLPQEVGRVVRTYPGKTQAWVLDPCGAFEELALDYEAVLGWEQAEVLDPLAQLAADLFKEIQESDGEALERVSVGRVRKVERARWARWLNQVVMAMRLRGWTELRVSSTSWRAHPMSQAQLQLIAKTIKLKRVAKAADKLRAEERALLKLACIAARSMELTKGQASDLIDVVTQIGSKGDLPR
jgi:superfamily II DNA or RNA helicase